MADFRLPATTRLGHVHLRVGDLDRALAFYEGVLGLRAERASGRAALAPRNGGPELVLLEERPGAAPRERGTTGLYHYAILLPDRRALAGALRRLLDVRWPIEGASDHAVSEAVYLADPDGNGIELYADRPRETWTWRHGELYMTTRPLDVAGLLCALGPDPEPWAGVPPGTVIGHVHLHVSGLARAEAFYHGVLGFDVVVRSYPGALFLSAGGYHHHIGVNVWAGPGATRPSPDRAGLIDFQLLVPAGGAAQVAERARAHGLDPRPAEGGFRLEDPDGNAVVVLDAR